MLLPVALILLAGGMYLRVQGAPGYGWVAPMLAGMGAVAIGLNLATGVRLARRNLRGIAAGMVTLATTVGIAVLQISLLKVLLVMLPVSLGLSLWRGRA
jgi:chromate transporter